MQASFLTMYNTNENQIVLTEAGRAQTNYVNCVAGGLASIHVRVRSRALVYICALCMPALLLEPGTREL